MSVQVLGDTIDFTTNISYTKNLILDVGKNITFMSGSSFVVSGNVYFPDSSKIFIGNNTSTLSTTLADGIPKGCIMMWYNGTIPTNWVSCDGNNGTAINGLTIPDLRGMFIIGSTGSVGSYPVNNKGGNIVGTENHKIGLTLENFPSHTHTGTTGTGGANHTHTFMSGWGTGGDSKNLRNTNMTTTGDTYATNADTHSHTLNIGNTVGSTPVTIIPPYYSLIYIIKTV
jgi:hypothetical protein